MGTPRINIRLYIIGIILIMFAFLYSFKNSEGISIETIKFNEDTLTEDDVKYLTDNKLDYVVFVKEYNKLDSITLNRIEHIVDDNGMELINIHGQTKVGTEERYFNIFKVEDEFTYHTIGSILDENNLD